MEKDKRILCYYIISYLGGLLDCDMSDLTDEEIIMLVEKIGNAPYDKLLSTYDCLNTMFIEKFGFNEEE